MSEPTLQGPTPLLAFHGHVSLREKYVEISRLSNIVWSGGEGEEPQFFEREFGIPTALGRLLGAMPQLLPQARQFIFAGQWLAALQPGADVSAVAESFIDWLITDAQSGASARAQDPALRESMAHVAQLHRQFQRAHPMARATWAAARRAVTLDDADLPERLPGSDMPGDVIVRVQNLLAAQVAADAAWPTTTTGSVAVSALQSWLALQEWQVRVQHAYFQAESEHYEMVSEAFMNEHAELILSERESGESGVVAMFEQRFSAEIKQREDFERDQSLVVQAAASLAADRLLVLLQACSKVGASSG